VSVFVDTSALVKLYNPESGHIAVTSIGEPLVIARLAFVELPAALWRKQREGHLSATAAATLTSAFEVDYYGDDDVEPRFAVVRLDDELLAVAAKLVARFPLRAGDAIQLASAIEARAAAPEITGLAAFDSRLRDAAAIEGFALIPRQL
jgi:hypothetical protein